MRNEIDPGRYFTRSATSQSLAKSCKLLEVIAEISLNRRNSSGFLVFCSGTTVSKLLAEKIEEKFSLTMKKLAPLPVSRMSVFFDALAIRNPLNGGAT